MPADRPRFLVLRGGAIGDFIVTLPVLQALRERWPGAWIEVMGYPHIAQLAVDGRLADRIVSLHTSHAARFYSLRPEFPDDQREYMRSFDIVFNFLHDPDGTVRENLATAGARQVVSGSPMIAATHASDHLLKPLESLAIYAAGTAARLFLPNPAVEDGQRRLASFGDPSRAVVLHPGSGGARKNWPADCFAELAGRLRGGRIPVFLFGEADDEAATVLARLAPDTPRLSGLALPEVARVLAAAGAYVGNDSGITHLAAAVGCPTFAIFGPTDSALWAPRGSNVHLLRAPDGDLARLTPVAVFDAMR